MLHLSQITDALVCSDCLCNVTSVSDYKCIGILRLPMHWHIFLNYLSVHMFRL